MSQRRKLNSSKRSYQGQDAGRKLVSYLNGNETKDIRGRQRILGIMEGFHKVLRLMGEYPESSEELTAADYSLNEKVGRYSRSLVFWAGKNGWNFSWGPLELKNDKQSGIDEWGAIDAIVELAHERLLSSVKKCLLCGKWLFATFSHQRFCSEKCRTYHNQSSPEFKQKRRKYMREYYRLQRNGNTK